MDRLFLAHRPHFARIHDNRRLLYFALTGLGLGILLCLFVIFYNPKSIVARLDVPELLGTVVLYSPETEAVAGTKLSTVKFKESYWPGKYVPQNAITDLSEIKEMYSRVQIAPGVPLLRSMITNRLENASLPVNRGNRAVAIDVDAQSSVDGFTVPGTHVDLVLTYQSKSEGMISKLIVENARVLSLGGVSVPLEKVQQTAARVASSKTIVLEVVPYDVLKIKTAGKLGSLSLAMREASDRRGSPVVTFSEKQLAGDPSEKRSGIHCQKLQAKSGSTEFGICDGEVVRLSDVATP